jgi:hypothetical protein
MSLDSSLDHPAQPDLVATVKSAARQFHRFFFVPVKMT